ncbi:MAG: hypothetical protein AAFS10_19750, partial [Myxococcota bacterium]
EAEQCTVAWLQTWGFHTKLFLQRVELSTLEGERTTVELPFVPERLVLGPSGQEAVLLGRETLVWVDLAKPDHPQVVWRPSAGQVVALRALGQGLVAVALGWGTHISGQWWMVLDMHHHDPRGQPLVLGHRVLGRVLDLAVVDDHLFLMESRGVLTRFQIARPHALTLLDRTYLHPSEPLYLRIDAAGQVHTPRHPVRRSKVSQWLTHRLLSPMVLSTQGDAQNR